MSDFDPNMAASIAAENTFQASQERPAATERERALAAEAARWERDWHRAHRETDRAIADIGVMILALRACDEAGEAVPARLRAHIRVMENEWFNLPTPEGAARREKLTDVDP